MARPAEGFEYWYAHQLGGGPYCDAPIWQQADETGIPASPVQPGTEPAYLTDVITRRALDFLIRHDGWKLVVRREGPTELYDLEEDPGEERDLPRDAAHAGRRRALEDDLHSWFEAHETLVLSGWGTEVDGTGQRRPVG